MTAEDSSTNNRSSSSAVVILKSPDGQSFELPYDAAIMSDFINDALGVDPDDENNDDKDDDKKEIDVLRVNGECLGKVVEFLIHHKQEPMKEIETPLKGNTFDEAMPQKWYNDFVSTEYMSQETLFDLLTAANYMGIKQLLDLACLKVTFELAGKNAEEIRQILNLPEMTPEEEARAREEHRWIFEDDFSS